MKKDEKKVLNWIIKIFWIFVIGSVFGFFAEMLYALVYTRTLQIRQGLIYGPFIQVYGMGAVAYYFLIRKFKEPKEAFFAGAIMGGILEYLFSFFQEILFGTISWDYSQWLFNINGRTTIVHCTYWGFAGLLYIKYIEPLIPKIENWVSNNRIKVMSTAVAVFMVFNITISSMAAIRQKERINNIPASSSVDNFLDNVYPDEYLNVVFENKKYVG